MSLSCQGGALDLQHKTKWERLCTTECSRICAARFNLIIWFLINQNIIRFLSKPNCWLLQSKVEMQHKLWLNSVYSERKHVYSLSTWWSWLMDVLFVSLGKTQSILNVLFVYWFWDQWKFEVFPCFFQGGWTASFSVSMFPPSGWSEAWQALAC